MSSPDSDDPDSRTPGDYPSDFHSPAPDDPSDYQSPAAEDRDSNHSSPYQPPPSHTPSPPSRQRTPNATHIDNMDDNVEQDDPPTAWEIAQARMRRQEQEGSYSPPSSADSDELRATRPNRWKGAPSTWRTMTEADREVWKAMEGGRKKDLTVHLVGAWGVRKGRRRGRVVTPEDGDDEDSEPASRAGTPRKRGKKRAWSPGKMWTAWPMAFQQVPDDSIMSEASGDEEPRRYKVPRTTRRRDLLKPNTNLEEAISATVLRIAKDKFLARGLGKEAVLESFEAKAEGGDGATDGEAGTGGEGGETDGGQTQKRRRGRSPASMKPVPTADDEASYALLRPVSKNIIGQLDETLRFLHHAREAGLGLKKRDVGPETETGVKTKKGKAAAKKGKATKSPGVTDGEKTDGERTDGEKMDIDPPAEEGARRGRTGKGKQPSQPKRSQSRSQSRSQAPPRSRSRSQAPSLARRIRKWATRDWRDIIGVAAMAGFSPKVIARATQRCSTLFNQPMQLHRMPDGPVPVETTTYIPGAPPPPSDDDNEAEIRVQQLRAVSRNSSRRTSVSLDTDGTPGKARRSTPGGGKEFPCPHFTCPRAIEPFGRRANLMRHLKTMHAGVEAAAQMAEQKSGDEMDGAVHVDGFLKTVRVRRGWRGEDTKARTRQKGLKYKTAGAGPSKPRTRKKSTFDSD